MRNPSRAVLPSDHEWHRPGFRAFLIVVGLIIALFSGVLAFLLLSAKLEPTWVIRFVSVFFAGIASYGGWLCWRGLRGYSVRRLETAQRYYDRYALALMLPTGLCLFALLRPASFTPLWYFATSLFVGPAQLVIHELSHVLAGNLVGLRFDSMAIGPFLIQKQHGRLKFTWMRLALHPGVEGWAKVQPRELRYPRLSTAVFAAGGPVGNLVAAGLAAALQWALGSHLGEKTSIGASLLDALFVWGVVTGLGNLVPFRVPGASFATDGLLLLRLATGSQEAPWERGPEAGPAQRYP